MTITAARAEYLSVTETAKLVRAALAKHFPGVKFSVRSSSYSGGASITASWTDGPRARLVEPILHGFEGASFDGMNDLKSSQSSWIEPDGNASLAERPDSYGGSISGYVSDAPHPNARLVHFGADFVFANRHETNWQEKETEALAYIRQHCTCEGTAPSDRFGNEWVDHLARGMVANRSEGETIETAFKRVIMREDI